MHFEFDAQYNKQEYIEFSHLSLSKKKYRHPTVRYWILGALLLVVSGLLLLVESYVFARWILIFTVFYFLFMLTMIVFMPRIGWKKMTEAQKGDSHFVFDEAGVTADSNGAGFQEQIHLAYDKLFLIVETPHSILLYIAQNQAFILPKRCIKSEELPLLIAQLREKVERKKFVSLVS